MFSNFHLSLITAILFLSGSMASVNDNPSHPKRPHIIIFMVDDMGFNDVSFRGSSLILTPNIDALGYQGVILNRHYVPAMCTPSRSALLTGKYPVNTGMQHFVIQGCEPYGLPLKFKLLPQYLKEAGYRTHLVGKWHQGFARKAYTPTERGFDTFFGFYAGSIYYYTHMNEEDNITGYDFRRNGDVTYEGLGKYTTHLFTNESLKIVQQHNPDTPLFLLVTYNAPHSPMEAPQEEMDKLSYIRDDKLRTYAAMIAVLDRGIGQIIKELSRKKMLDNSVILFYSDNGGPSEGLFSTEASNYPLRGQKNSPWEGGLRVPAAFWSPKMQVRHIVSDQVIHNTDWLPTFLRMAGIKPTRKIDGFDMWPTLTKQTPSPRTEVIHNIDPIDGFSSYYRKGWKYINGTNLGGKYDSWLGARVRYSNPNAPKYAEIVRVSDAWEALSPFAEWSLTSRTIKKIRQTTRAFCQGMKSYGRECNPVKAPCLFRIVDDPCEQNNLAEVFPFQMRIMAKWVEKYKARSAVALDPPQDFAGCDPRKFNGTLSPWLDDQKDISLNVIGRDHKLSYVKLGYRPRQSPWLRRTPYYTTRSLFPWSSLMDSLRRQP